MGHQVFCPDLPGHGKNDTPSANISLKSCCRYIAEYIEQIPQNIILVGHSMSGMIISQVAEELPGRMERLIYLSAYLPCHGQSLFDLIAANRENGTQAAIETAMVMSEDKRYCWIEAASIKPLFYNRCPEEVCNLIPSELPQQATLPLSGKVRLTDENFGQIDKTYICCLDDNVIPIAHQRQMLKKQQCNEMIQLDADHSPFISCPETLASVLHSCSLAL